MKLPLSYPPIRKASKIGLAQICSRQERELIALRSLRTKGSTTQSPIVVDLTAKEKFAAEVAAAKAKHAEFIAKEAAEVQERDRKQAEWDVQFRAQQLKGRRESARRKWAESPEKHRQYSREYNRKHREARNEQARARHAAKSPEQLEHKKAKHTAGARLRRQKEKAARQAKEQIRAGMDLLEAKEST